jgi:hypothetical protein
VDEEEEEDNDDEEEEEEDDDDMMMMMMMMMMTWGLSASLSPDELSEDDGAVAARARQLRPVRRPRHGHHRTARRALPDTVEKGERGDDDNHDGGGGGAEMMMVTTKTMII